MNGNTLYNVETKNSEVTDKKITDFARRWAVTPHLMDVGFFQNPTWENWVKATRAYNQTGVKPPQFKMASPWVDDTAKAIKAGYKEFMLSLIHISEPTRPY